MPRPTAQEACQAEVADVQLQACARDESCSQAEHKVWTQQEVDTLCEQLLHKCALQAMADSAAMLAEAEQRFEAE
eukprot:14945323-Alexandrium_andersonii.AAC.1